MPKLADQHTEWVESNPLRKWRKEQGLSLNMVAAQLGVVAKSVQLWESGAGRPTGENLAKIADMAGVKVSTLSVRWDRWQQQAPGNIAP